MILLFSRLNDRAPTSDIPLNRRKRLIPSKDNGETQFRSPS